MRMENDRFIRIARLRDERKLQKLVAQSREELSAIHRKLNAAVYPLSNLPNRRHHWPIGNAISAIGLAQQILRDIDWGIEPKEKK